MEKHKIIKDIIENGIREGIKYKEEMITIGRGYDISNIAELTTRQLEIAFKELSSETQTMVSQQQNNYLKTLKNNNMTKKQEAQNLVDEFRFIIQDEDTDCGNEILCTIIAKKCAKVS